jgi:hypothetical protein
MLFEPFGVMRGLAGLTVDRLTLEIQRVTKRSYFSTKLGMSRFIVIDLMVTVKITLLIGIL